MLSRSMMYQYDNAFHGRVERCSTGVVTAAVCDGQFTNHRPVRVQTESLYIWSLPCLAENDKSQAV